MEKSQSEGRKELYLFSLSFCIPVDRQKIDRQTHGVRDSTA